MKFVPKPYQPRMSEWLATHDAAGLWAEPGMGKSVVTLDHLDHLLTSGLSRGALILSPLRVSLCTWPSQFERWDHSKWMKVANLRTPEGLKSWREGASDAYLLNFDMLVTRAGSKKKGFIDTYLKGQKELPVDTLVIDETSCFKDASSKRFKALAPYVKMFKQRIGLTGTPGNYEALWSQVKLLDGGERLGVSYTAYLARYFTTDYMGYTYTLKPGAKEEIDAKISDLCLVMLGADHLDIPPTHYEDIEVTIPAEARKQYKTLEKELLLEIEKSEIIALNAAVLMNKLLQVVGGAVYDLERNIQVIHTAKVDALKKLVKNLKGEPLLVLVAYKHESARILKAIPQARMFHEKDLDEWCDGKIPVWVADARSLSHGLDRLQHGGSKLCWFTLTWGEAYQQTNARLVRTGQEKPTTVYRLLVPGTADDAVVEALRNRSDTQTGLMTALKNLQILAKNS